MLKKFVGIVFIVILVFIGVSYNSLIFGAENSQIEKTYAHDEVGYLSKLQIDAINIKLKNLRDKYKMDYVFYIGNELRNSYGMQDSADDIFDYDGYGYGSNRDGIILYICDKEGDYWFSTRGYGMTAFNSDAIDKLCDKIEPILRNEDFYGAAEKFIVLATEMSEMARNGKPYKNDSLNKLIKMGSIIAAIVLPFIIASISTASKVALMNTSVKDDYASNYIKEGSMILERDSDVFLYSNVTRTPKPKPKSDSHVSSSGASHGGGGGSFR